MKYKHIITIAYPAKDNGTLVMHFNFIDESPAQYTRNDLINIYLCNEIPGQDIWGTYYERNNYIFPIFYCKKELGQARMLLKGQTAAVDNPIFELDNWDITGVNGSVVSFTSNTIKLND